MVVFNHIPPTTNIQSTSTHQGEFLNSRYKRAPGNIRIHRHYDVSFTATSKYEDLKMKIVEPAITFWEDALMVKNPIRSPLLFDRDCENKYYYHNRGHERIKACVGQCQIDQKCHNTVIPKEFLARCYISNADGSYLSYGEDGSGAQNSDIIIIITYLPDSCEKNTLAYATACYLEHISDRPVLGLINLCPGKLNTGINLQTSISTLKHEIVHILGFSPILFPFFRDPDGNPLTPRDDYGWPNMGVMVIDDFTFLQWSKQTVMEKKMPATYRTGNETKSIFVLVTPNIRKEVRHHFNCSTLDGLYLEDNGSIHNILSHFEKRIFQNELMTPSISVQALVSRFTMAFLQDTGWYEVDYNKADKYDFARNIGCDFITKTCFEYINTHRSRNISVYPYCNSRLSADGLKCSIDLRSVKYCSLLTSSKLKVPLKYRYFKDLESVSTDPFSEYCPYQLEFVQTDSENVIHNGMCTDSYNNAITNTKYDFYTEGFGPNSACIMFEKSEKWYYKSCGKIVYPSISGAGCYNYRCSKVHRLVIQVNGFDYQCRSDGQIIDVTSKAKYLISYGKLICPKCSALCNKSICNSHSSFLPVKCNNISRPCPGMVPYAIPCSSCLFKMSVLYFFVFALTIIFLYYF